MISRYGPFTSFQVNVDANGNNIVGDAANEPSIAVDPTDLNKMTIGWRQFNSVASNFRQGGYGYTTDGGTTWTFPGVLENNVFRSDPVLNSNETGNFFYLSLRETFYDDMTGKNPIAEKYDILVLRVYFRDHAERDALAPSLTPKRCPRRLPHRDPRPRPLRQPQGARPPRGDRREQQPRLSDPHLLIPSTAATGP